MTFAEIKPPLFLVLSIAGIMVVLVVYFFHERRHWRRKALLHSRPQVSSWNFGAKFYEDPQQAKIADYLRNMLAKYLEVSLDGLLPSDRLKEDLLFDLWAFPDLFWYLEKELGIKTEIDELESDDQFKQLFDSLVTFHDLVCYVEGKLKTAQKP